MHVRICIPEFVESSNQTQSTYRTCGTPVYAPLLNLSKNIMVNNNITQTTIDKHEKLIRCES